MKFEVDFNDKEAAIIENYLKRTDRTISQVAKRAILEMIFDDDADLAAYERAMEEYKKDPTTYTLAEVRAHLGLN